MISIQSTAANRTVAIILSNDIILVEQWQRLINSKPAIGNTFFMRFLMKLSLLVK